MIAAMYGKTCSNAGPLDLTFNNSGYVRFGFGAGTDTGKAVALQPDGKIGSPQLPLKVADGRTYAFLAMAKSVRFSPRVVMIGGDLTDLDLIAN